jgi:hypothetical protein
MIDAYIKEIASITKHGDTSVESYYSALAELLEESLPTREAQERRKGAE